MPWTTVAVFFISVTAIVVLVVTGHGSAELVTTLSVLLPGVLSTTFFAERNNKQLNNGHMKNSVKQAITELGAKAPKDDEA